MSTIGMVFVTEMAVVEAVDLERIPVDEGIPRLRHIFPTLDGVVAYCGHRKVPGPERRLYDGRGRYCRECHRLARADG